MNPDLKRRVQRYGWDKASEFYEKSWEQQLKPAHDLLLETAQVKKGESILDIAAGTGLITFRMAEKVGYKGNILATDLSDEMVKIGNNLTSSKSLSNVEFRRMDAENLPIDSGIFDLVTCALGIMYFPDPDKALSEMYRVLKPGGRCVVAIWGSRKKCGWAEIFPIVDSRVSSDVCPMFFNLGEKDVIKFPFQKAGFEDVSIQKIEVNLHYPNEEEACQASFMGGPVAMAYSRFDDKNKEDAHREYNESIQAYKTENGYDIPGEFVVASGVKN